MKRVMMSVRDSAGELFGQPFFVTAVGAAVRGFADEVNRAAPDNAVFQHPEHFDLYKVGTFEDDTGQVTGIIPEHVVAARDLLKTTDIVKEHFPVRSVK